MERGLAFTFASYLALDEQQIAITGENPTPVAEELSLGFGPVLDGTKQVLVNAFQPTFQRIDELTIPTGVWGIDQHQQRRRTPTLARNRAQEALRRGALAGKQADEVTADPQRSRE